MSRLPHGCEQFPVPDHAASVVACLAGLMLLQSVRSRKGGQQVAAMVVAGLAFALTLVYR